MADVVSLAERRPPVHYTVQLSHHWTGEIDVFVEDVANDERSRASVKYALALAAEKFGSFPMKEADALHALALAHIDSLMSAAEGSPEAESLSRWADAVQSYEQKRFPGATP